MTDHSRALLHRENMYDPTVQYKRSYQPHRQSWLFHDSPPLLNISYHNGHRPNLFLIVKTNMPEKGRRSDSSQLIPRIWEKHSLATYLEPQIF